MNYHELTLNISSPVTGVLMGKLDLKVGYYFKLGLPSEVFIATVLIKNTEGLWMGTAFLGAFMDEGFWQELTQEILDQEVDV